MINQTRVVLHENSELIVLVKDTNRKITLRLDEDALAVVSNTTDDQERSGEIFRVSFTEAALISSVKKMRAEEKERRKDVKFKLDVGTFVFRAIAGTASIGALLFSAMNYAKTAGLI